ncbi:MAG: biotin synthase [Crenarchaeota archaeon]|nr:biotin synthase [Thermoproteota archaeon]
MRVRASIGTLAAVGILDARLDDAPTTAYLLQDCERCLARCAFCGLSYGMDRIARVTWPRTELEVLLPELRRFQRVCLQTVLKRGWVEEATRILEAVHSVSRHVSIALTPVPKSYLRNLAELCDFVGVGLDAPSPASFRRCGKPFTWSTYMKFIESCAEVFGKGAVYVHIIAGLGDSVADVLRVMKRLYSMGCRVALFSYVATTPARFPGIDVLSYRFLQVARQCLEEGIDPEPYVERLEPTPRFRRAPPISNPLMAVLTSGCPGCNRPFYNESPRGPIMNFPSLRMVERLRESVERELELVGAL